jgi:hypothetical protein
MNPVRIAVDLVVPSLQFIADRRAAGSFIFLNRCIHIFRVLKSDSKYF